MLFDRTRETGRRSGPVIAAVPCAVIGLLALLVTAGSARAMPVAYQLSGVTFNDGGTASGTFTFDADAGTACSTHSTVCGQYSNVDVVTTSGASRSGATYTDVCGTDVPSCTGVSPNSTEVLFLTSSSSDQTGLPGLAFFFTGAGATPPAGLSDAGGTFDVSNSDLTVGALQEANCNGSDCSAPAAPSRVSTAGFVVAQVPEPASCALIASGLTSLLAQRLRSGRKAKRSSRHA